MGWETIFGPPLRWVLDSLHWDAAVLVAWFGFLWLATRKWNKK